MPLAAVRHFPAEHIECLGRLVEELGRRFHDKSSWVSLPGSQDGPRRLQLLRRLIGAAEAFAPELVWAAANPATRSSPAANNVANRFMTGL